MEAQVSETVKENDVAMLIKDTLVGGKGKPSIFLRSLIYI